MFYSRDRHLCTPFATTVTQEIYVAHECLRSRELEIVSIVIIIIVVNIKFWYKLQEL